MEQEAMYSVLDPSGIRPVVKMIPINPRIDSLGNKLVYCVSQHVGGADTFQKKVAEQLSRYAPGVKAVYVDKPSWYGADDPGLWDEIATKADAVIYAAAA